MPGDKIVRRIRILRTIGNRNGSPALNFSKFDNKLIDIKYAMNTENNPRLTNNEMMFSALVIYNTGW